MTVGLPPFGFGIATDLTLRPLPSINSIALPPLRSAPVGYQIFLLLIVARVDYQLRNRLRGHLDKLASGQANLLYGIEDVGVLLEGNLNGVVERHVRHLGIALLGDENGERLLEIGHDHLLLHGQFLAVLEVRGFPRSFQRFRKLSGAGQGKVELLRKRIGVLKDRRRHRRRSQGHRTVREWRRDGSRRRHRRKGKGHRTVRKGRRIGRKRRQWRRRGQDGLRR